MTIVEEYAFHPLVMLIENLDLLQGEGGPDLRRNLFQSLHCDVVAFRYVELYCVYVFFKSKAMNQE
jgi:hypothetical protein